MTDALTQKRNDFFTSKFRELLDEWKQGQREKNEPYSNEEFARKIREAEKKSGNIRGKCDYRFVSKWYTGKMFPETYLEEIADVLGVSVEVFSPQTHSEKYKHDAQFQNDLGDALLNFSKEIGLDSRFVELLKNQTDFGNEFPSYTPVELKSITFLDEEFKRVPRDRMSEAETMNKENYRDVYQYERDCQVKEKTETRIVDLSRPDLAFLKDVQDEVISLVEYLFWKREKEMIKEVEEMNNLLHDDTMARNGITRDVYESVVKYSEFEGTGNKNREVK